MEEKLNRKLLLIAIKYFPWIIASINFVELILSCFGVEMFILAAFGAIGIVPTIGFILFSIALKFCIWHRLPLYYTTLTNSINAIDFYFGIPVCNKWMLIIYLIITALFVLIGAYKKNKYNANKRKFERRP